MSKTFGIVGNGFIAPRHKAAIEHVGGSLEWVCDADRDYREMPKTDYVSICTPNYLHYEMAKYFAEQGTTVLTEKPPVLKAEQTREFNDLPVYVVLQLRNHPKVLAFKEQMKKGTKYGGTIKIVVKRDADYWNSWKGKEEQSGGIVFNIGVHYVDLLWFLFGEGIDVDNHRDVDSNKGYRDDKNAWGILNFKKNEHIFYYNFAIHPTNEFQERTLELYHGNEMESLDLSKQDNLSFEDLHKKVYEDLVAGRGTHIKETYPVIKLIEHL